ncbi:PAS domain-containing sensor histidine kinase [Edaphobacter paludis]|uniref:histidine kinase n=1 Tax=Edaphobacter paludis TaxID=3035702 RepID=A0AAU7D390_9BACT
MLSSVFQGSKKSVLVSTSVLIVVIALIDWRAINELPLGFLYLLPMLMVGRILNPRQIALVAALCTFLTEIFDEFVWSFRTGIPRDILYFSGFFCAGLFVCEINRSRRTAIEHLHEIERQRDARRDAEDQLKVLVESSPAAIVTTDSTGCVVMANEAAHRMLALQPGVLPGQLIHRYFPSLVNVSRQEATPRLFRTMMQSRGQRADGEVFLAEICFSTYRTNGGTRLAAMILDTSEELRTREESSLHQMLAGSRIAAAAVSHEVRNVSGAISVVHQNLARSGLLSQNKDFEALGSLLHALERIAGVDLRQYTDQTAETDLTSVLDDVRIVVAPALREAGIEGRWEIPSELPVVWADQQNLMQVFLNLASNSIRALTDRDDKKLSIVARVSDQYVLIEFTDNAGGVAYPDQLFRPFQREAQITGLGLFLSRAFMRACRGELRYRPIPGGACFIVEMPIVEQSKGLA